MLRIRWMPGKVTKYATCTEAGVKTYSCTVCGAVDHTEAIPATGAYLSRGRRGHRYQGGHLHEPGIMSYTCTVCGQGAYTEPIQALGHQFELVEATEPTCTGTRTRAVYAVHALRGGKRRDHGGARDRTQVDGVGGDARELRRAGERTRTCTICDEVESEELEAGAHSWDDGVISKAPDLHRERRPHQDL